MAHQLFSSVKSNAAAGWFRGAEFGREATQGMRHRQAGPCSSNCFQKSAEALRAQSIAEFFKVRQNHRSVVAKDRAYPSRNSVHSVSALIPFSTNCIVSAKAVVWGDAESNCPFRCPFRTKRVDPDLPATAWLADFLVSLRDIKGASHPGPAIRALLSNFGCA